MNHFIKVTDVEGAEVAIRPDHISAVVVYPGEDYSVLVLSNAMRIEIPKGQISLDCLANKTQEAGVRVL